MQNCISFIDVALKRPWKSGMRSSGCLSPILMAILAFVAMPGCEAPPVRSVLVQTSPNTVELRGERVLALRFLQEAEAECDRRGVARGPDVRARNDCVFTAYMSRIAHAMRLPPAGCQAIGNNLVCDTDQYRMPLPMTADSGAPTSAFGRARAACEARNLRWGDSGYQACLDRDLATVNSPAVGVP